MVSIVLPCYNGAKMIGEAIESIIAQTYTDWELIIVNDCSTDNTLEVAKSYAAKDKRIRVFSNEKNSKLPATLNHGFREARGEYWTWTSDDNLLLPTMLEELCKFLDENPEVGFVISDLANIDIDGNILSYDLFPDNIAEQLPLRNCVGASFMYRSSVAQKAGEYREDLFLVEDYEYWIRLLSYTKFAHIPKVLYQYRIHSQSLTSTRQKEIAENLLNLRLLYLDIMEKRLANDTQTLSLYYYGILDGVRGVERVKYYIRFAKKLPFKIGIRYICIHIPHKLYKTYKKNK